MKKNKRLIILIIILLAVITIAIFDKIDFQSISKSAYLEIEKEIVFSKVDNFEINPKKAKLILDDKNNKQAATGRYANITPAPALSKIIKGKSLCSFINPNW